MDPFEALVDAVERAGREQDLPDYLAERILRIAADREGYGRMEERIARLAGQVRDYDTYAQCGYLAMGVNNTVLEGAVARLEALRRGPGEGGAP